MEIRENKGLIQGQANNILEVGIEPKHSGFNS